MPPVGFISIATAILGIIALVLLFLKNFERYRTALLTGTLLMFAVSIGVYLTGSPKQPDTPSEPLVANTPTLIQAEVQLSTPPISPISPLATPEPTSTKVDVTHVAFAGCLLFASNRSGDLEIYELQENIDSLQQLTNSPGLDIDPTWSPDGKKIAFASNREDDAGFQIYVMNADGSDQRRLGDIQPGDNSHPSWSPDGSQILFQSRRDASGAPGDENLDIYVMNSDGSDVRVIASHPADDSQPSWSPDGRKIAFLSERSGQDEVYLMDPDGSNIEQLTELLELKSGPSWSSDSQQIVFEGSGDIYAVNVETKELTKLVSDSDSNEVTPIWAQEDNWVIFSSNRTQDWELYILDLGDISEPVLYQVTDEPGIDRSPDWFPCTR